MYYNNLTTIIFYIISTITKYTSIFVWKNVLMIDYQIVESDRTTDYIKFFRVQLGEQYTS